MPELVQGWVADTQDRGTPEWLVPAITTFDRGFSFGGLIAQHQRKTERAEA